MIKKQSTSVRLDSHLHALVLKEAKKAGLSFSGVVHLLLQAFVQGDVRVGVIQQSHHVHQKNKKKESLPDLYDE